MPKLSDAEINSRMDSIPDWERDGQEIKRLIVFDSFMDGIAFVTKVANCAENADHHPDIDIRYKKVLFTLSTHSEGGLTEKDFNLAREIDGLNR